MKYSVLKRNKKMKGISKEMEDWLVEKWNKTEEGCFVPLLICQFRDEFGYKKSGVPDSLSIKEATNLVEIWIAKNG